MDLSILRSRLQSFLPSVAAIDDPAILEERYRSLQRQIPLLYLIALANIFGLHLVTGDVFTSVSHPANLLVLLVTVRLVHWARHRRSTPPLKIIRHELWKTYALAGVFSASFGLWAIGLLDEVVPQHQNSVILFASLTGVGCAYGLSSFPAAARLPLLLAALPISVRLAFSSNTTHIAMGISLGLVTLLILRLLSVQNAGITQLVRSRHLVERERERARAAEIVAVHERQKAEQTANTDPLTGLLNRRAFLAAFAKGVHQRRTLAIVDLDGFKPINDTFGHAAGDAVLVEVGRRLLEAAGLDATVARMGGDEFAVLLPVSGDTAAAAAGEAICLTLEQPYHVGPRQFQVTASCGMAIVEEQASNVSHALRRADLALYRAKLRGRGATAVYSTEMDAAATRRALIEASLQEERVQESISLVYQPIMDLQTGELRCFEALARWNDPQLGEVSPSEFIQVAEQTNAIEALSGKLLRKAAREAKAWPRQVVLSFNVSAAELCACGAAERILAVLRQEAFDPARLQIEITETTMLTDLASAGSALDELRAAGVKVVLDDFGAGFASVSYLRQMKFDGIKLDGGLLVCAQQSETKDRLLKGVIELCKALELPCVAEHLETADQLRLLRDLRCDFGQGYLLSKPLNSEQARRFATSMPLEASAGRLRKKAA
jgi:diguanylate cyclase (GGDEF)-like protein